MERLVVDGLGWVGAVALTVAYGLVSTRRVEGDAFVYQVMNAMGSAFLIVNTAYYGAYPSTALNVVWGGVALHALWSRSRRRAAP
jgi:hypothetical protein